jgi:hypothetical protein
MCYQFNIHWLPVRHLFMLDNLEESIELNMQIVDM